MYTETITYTDFNGKERTEDYYFNLTRFELINLERSHEGGYVEAMTKSIKDNDVMKMLDLIQEIVLKAYGEKSEDGRRFIKSAALSGEFEESAAYTALMEKFIENPEYMNMFFENVFPKYSEEQYTEAKKKLEEETGITMPTQPRDIPR